MELISETHSWLQPTEPQRDSRAVVQDQTGYWSWFRQAIRLTVIKMNNICLYIYNIQTTGLPGKDYYSHAASEGNFSILFSLITLQIQLATI